MRLVHWSVRFLHFNNGVTAARLRAVGAMNNLRDVIVSKLKTFLNDLVSSGREHTTELQLSVPRSLPGNQPFALCFFLSLPSSIFHAGTVDIICLGPSVVFLRVFFIALLVSVIRRRRRRFVCASRCSCLCLSALLCE